MATERLDIRLDPQLRRELAALASEEGVSVSEMVRRLITRAYEEDLSARRVAAAQAISDLQVEDVPDPEDLTRQLEGAHEPGGID